MQSEAGTQGKANSKKPEMRATRMNMTGRLQTGNSKSCKFHEQKRNILACLTIYNPCQPARLIGEN